MLSPLVTPKDISQTWLEKLLSQRMASDVKIDSWTMKCLQQNDGCFSEMYFVDIAYTVSGGCKGERSLVMKFMPQGQLERELMGKCGLGKREAEIYNYSGTENFKVFCQNAGVLHSVPEVYWVDPEKNVLTIVLQNLYKDGYKIVAPLEGNSLDETKCILRSIAVVHAYGVGNLKNCRLRGMGSPYHVDFDQYLKAGIEMQIKLFNDDPVVDKLKALISVSEELLNVAEKYPFIDTLVHGDMWNDNTMFSSDKKSVCIFDWQFGHIGNPLSDVTTLLLIGAHPDVYNKHLTETLQYYWDVFEQSLKKNGHSVSVTFEDMLRNLEDLWMHGYVFYSFCLPFRLADDKSEILSDDRMRAIVHFLDKRGVFAKYSKSRQ